MKRTAFLFFGLALSAACSGSQQRSAVVTGTDTCVCVGPNCFVDASADVGPPPVEASVPDAGPDAVAVVDTGAPDATPPPTGSLALRVSGNAFLNAAGKPVLLRGVDRSGTEYACIEQGSSSSRGWGIFDGPNDAASLAAIVSWHANAIRIPLNEDCWLGLGGVNPAYGGAAYQTAILAYVQLAHKAGLYTILDLHWSAPGNAAAQNQQEMADADHSIAFWQSVARAYSSDPGSLFDAYNEPWLDQDPKVADAWGCWLNGCALTSYELSSGSASANWQAAGMQQIVNAIRGTGATNVVLAGGVGWASDVSGWLSHRPQDSAGQLAASWHSYSDGDCNTSSCWNSVVAPLAAQVPVVVGETGDVTASTPTFINGFLPWVAASKLAGIFGWTWDTWGSTQPDVLIQKYDGTPTANYGAAYQKWLQAQPLTTRPLRRPRHSRPAVRR